MFLSFVPRHSDTAFRLAMERAQAILRAEKAEAKLNRVLDAYIIPPFVEGDHFSVQLPGWGTRVAATREDARALILSAVEGD